MCRSATGFSLSSFAPVSRLSAVDPPESVDRVSTLLDGSLAAESSVAQSAAVVVAHARLDLAHTCVLSLRRWLPPERITVVLNVPAVVGRAAVAAISSDAVVISPSAPQGYGANLNLGVRTLGPEVDVAILANDDVVFGDESIPRLVERIRQDPSAGLAGPQLVWPDGSEAESFGSFPTIEDEIRHMAMFPWPAMLPRRFGAAQSRALMSHHRVASTPDWVVGAAFAVRLSAFHAVGGFDEDFLLNFEETDLCYRLSRRAWTVAWCPEASVTHLKRSSMSSSLSVETYNASRRLFFRKRLGSTRWFLAEVMLIGVFCGSIAYSLVTAIRRPRIARDRYRLLRERWRARVFLRPSQPRVSRRIGAAHSEPRP
jgi:N-acetylglucosaminyl-diphospho-decaprenol L-rhamnosyltransferase